MKSIIVMLLSLCMFFFTSAQTAAENEIRKLEEAQREAFIKKDTVLLYKIFSPHFVVHAPTNKIIPLEELKLLIKNGEVDLASFERVIEKITFVKNIAIVMGAETTKATGNNPNAGKTAKRRYTHIWIKNKNTWMLVARQGTNISLE